MSIKIKTVARKNPSKPAAAALYYPVIETSGEVKLRELSNQIARFTTQSQPDVMATLEALLQIVPELLGQGNIVRLGDLGSFYVSIQSNGVPKEADVSVNQIEDFKVRFRSGSVLKNMMEQTSFEKKAN